MLGTKTIKTIKEKHTEKQENELWQSNASNYHHAPLRILMEIVLIFELRFFDFFDPLDPP